MRRAIAGDLPERYAGQLRGIAVTQRLTERFPLSEPVSFTQRVAPAVPDTCSLAGAIAVAIADAAPALSFTPANAHLGVRDGPDSPFVNSVDEVLDHRSGHILADQLWDEVGPGLT